jgi:epoxyqueuosine reductase QueG
VDLLDIRRKAAEFSENSPLNYVEYFDGMRIYDIPLIASASADDPLLESLKSPDAVSPAHMSPKEWLENAQTVISYFLPFSEAVRKANRLEGPPALEWLYGRIEGEQFNVALREFLVKEITEAGGKAAAPQLDSRFKVVNKRSNWSERHVAYIAGLGTFGLGRSLITEKGCAGRIGSVITDLKLDTTARAYKDIYEYCTWCGECISRCPAGAINEKGKDVAVCSDYLDNVISPRYVPRYGCGKCQTAVPCEYGRPK